MPKTRPRSKEKTFFERRVSISMRSSPRHSMNFLSRILSPLVGASLFVLSFAGAAEPAQPVESKTLHNVFKLEGGLYSGDAPEGDDGFRELQKFGVKTIISVDGSKPNVELAHKYGMRYVHLPIGYDGLPKSRALELTKAVQVSGAAGPIYVHCHHGQHRGPAAAAVICRATQGWSAEKADEFLKQAGTSASYPGLFRDVGAFGVPTAEELGRIPGSFPEVAPTPPLVDTMVAIDGYFDALKAAQKAGWKEIPGHPDLQPAQAAVLMWEAFRELHRDPESKKRGEDYLAKMSDGETAADALRGLLSDPARDAAACDAALQSMTKNCGACHKAHRN
jgi:hypothetical protein